MFNIKNIVNKITDRARESQPNSPARVQGDDILSRHVAEGFLCPKCMKAFASQEDLQIHYQSSHNGDQHQSEGFLCPTCIKPFSSPEDLQAHFRVHGAEMDVPPPWEETDHVKQQQDGSLAAAKKLDIEDITDPEELKQRLIEALECKSILLNEKERLEHKSSHLARHIVALQAASDEGNDQALKERLKIVEAQLAHRESIDDAAVLRLELVQVQRVMDELTREKEREVDKLKAELQQLEDLQAAKEIRDSTKKLGELEIQEDTTVKDLEISLDSHKKLLLEAKENLSDKISEIDNIKRELDFVTERLEERDKLIEVLQCQIAELHSVEEKMKDIDVFYENTRKMNEDKEEEVKACHARVDAVNIQKEILISELQHKTKLCEELEKSNSAYVIELTRYKDEMSRLESERAELLNQFEAGEGANTAIQQLSQKKVLLTNQLKEETENHSKTVEKLKSKIRDLERQNNGLVAQLNSVSTVLREAEGDLLFATQELEKRIAETDDLRTEKEACVELKENLESALERNSKLLIEADEKVKMLDKTLEDCRLKLNDLEARKTKLEGNVRDKEMEMNKLQAYVSILETRLADSVSEVKILQAELSTEKSNYTKLQEEKHKTASDLTTKLSNILIQKSEVIASLEMEKLEVHRKLEESNCEKERIEEEGKKELEVFKAVLNESKMSITEHEKREETFLNENEKLSEKIRELEETLVQAEANMREKEDGKEAVKMELLLEHEKHLSECQLENKVDELKKMQAYLDEVAGEKLALEAQLAASQSEQQALLERCFANSAESESQRKYNADLRRRLEESQAALHELGRENQTLQLELEKLFGRKWTEDSDVVNCTLCQKEFSILVRKHHCRNCGQIFCNECSSKLAPLQTNKKPVRVCDSCYSELGHK